jgi:hypothetical protein
MAGKVSGGEILGEAWNSRPALEAVRRAELSRGHTISVELAAN